MQHNYFSAHCLKYETSMKYSKFIEIVIPLGAGFKWEKHDTRKECVPFSKTSDCRRSVRKDLNVQTKDMTGL